MIPPVMGRKLHLVGSERRPAPAGSDVELMEEILGEDLRDGESRNQHNGGAPSDAEGGRQPDDPAGQED